MTKYDPRKVEKKWQKIWAEKGIYEPDLKKAARPFYNLMMFPYPSGEGLHIGHMYAFSGADTFGRFMKMQGFDVFEPMGFDAFGIHSENYAIKVGKHPRELIKETTTRYREQLKRAGLALDWSHEVNTTDPKYYKWTQWIFLQLFKAGLAERKKAPVNWCPSCKTVLADEQVIAGRCERCDTEVEQKELEQWFLRITKYAEKLDKNLNKIDWSENVKKLQRNWIGRSEGTEVVFNLKSQISNLKTTTQNLKLIKVFTTRIDTIFGATFLVLSPEHELAQAIAQHNAEVKRYIEESQKKTEQERIEREKTGVFTGLYAINPATGQEIPVWVADFVLGHYGGGAVMGVPAHDQRDFEFAKKYDLPIVEVIKSQISPPKAGSPRAENLKSQNDNPKSKILEKAYEGEGILVNSRQFDGMQSEKAREEITKWLAKKGLAKKAVTYRLRDWLISRQRYWGPPIPIIYCRKCWEI
jgi:leucyl-tRNA synthetase